MKSLPPLALLLDTAVVAQGAVPQLKVSENRRSVLTADGRAFFWSGDTAWEFGHAITSDVRRPLDGDRFGAATRNYPHPDKARKNIRQQLS
jgi:hypothetical protein